MHLQKSVQLLGCISDVLVMGYPKIPTFTNFLTAEKATISSKAEARLTPTKGAIAAFGENYLSKAELMLITAKLEGEIVEDQ